MHQALSAFLIGFPALFSIVNPISGAFIFRAVTERRTEHERSRLARTVAIYAFLVMAVALWAGSYVLTFFGVSLAALRVAGGLVVALSAWDLLNHPENQEGRKQQQAEHSEYADDVAMFPLTIPFTTGPGTIAVAITLGAGHLRDFRDHIWYFLGMTVAALGISVMVWIAYRSAERMSRMMGPTGSRTLTRLSAFLLLCIGVQILITGVEEVLGALLAKNSAPS